MAYADLLDNEGIRSEYLVVMKPSRRMTGFTLFSGSVYSMEFTLGEVISMTQNGTALAAGSSSSLSAGQFYYDVDTSTLYVRMSDSSDPSTKFVVGVYEIYASTSAEHFHRTPTDSSTRQVFFNALVKTPPIIKDTQSDGIIGYIPVQGSSIVLINAEHEFEPHLYDSSFNRKTIEVYHWLDELTVDNLKLVLKGTMGDPKYTSTEVSISIQDRIDVLQQEYRNPVASFWASSDFPDLDPNFLGRPIRAVYGRVDGFVPVNLDYVLDGATTSDNRVWGVRAEKTKLNDVTRTVAASPASTTTRVYLTSVLGLDVGDTVLVNKATDESAVITAVGANYIDVSPAFASGAPVGGDTVIRPTISRVSIIQNNVRYDALYGRDYAMNTSLAQDVLGFTFDTALESNLGLPQVLSPNDKVFVRVYGKQNDVTLGGNPLGIDDNQTSNLTAPAPIIVDLLKKLGLVEADLNTASFTSLQSATTEALSFAIPATSTQEFPTFKKILGEIIQTILLRLVRDTDSKIKVNLVAPLGSEDKSIDQTEILAGSVSYEFSYADLVSFVRVEYAFREQADDAATGGNTVSVATATSDTARYLHGVDRQMTSPSLHLKASDAETLALHLSQIFGDRSGRLTFATKNRFFDSEISDTILVSREKLPGFIFESGTERQRKFSVLSASKGLRQITLELDDQKGIEDADDEGDW